MLDGLLQSELHEFTALSLVVAHWNIVFSFAVTDTDDPGGSVDATLKLAFVAILLWIWIFGVSPAVARDAVRGIIAIRSVKLYES